MKAARIIQLTCLTILCLATTACPFPILPQDEGPKALDQNTPSTIQIGVTTREDILLLLGEPRTVSENELYYVYTREQIKGGVGIFMAAGSGAGGWALGRQGTQRLFIEFDDRGIVSNAKFDTDTCPWNAYLFGSAGGSSNPCLDVYGEDILATKPDATGIEAGERYGPLRRLSRHCGFPAWQDIVTEPQSSEVVLVLTAEKLELFGISADRNSAPNLSINFGDIQDVAIDKFGRNRRIVVRQQDGVCETLWAEKKSGAIDIEQTTQIGERLKTLWQQNKGKSLSNSREP